MKILDKVAVKLNSNNYSYYINLGYKITGYIDSKKRHRNYKRGQVLYVNPEDLPAKSNVKIKSQCDICKNIRLVAVCTYSDICYMCNINKYKGVDHYNYDNTNPYTGRDRVYHQVLINRYGITLDTYLTMLEKQNYCCAICNKSQSKEGRRFVVDHNHKTNKNRQLLCNRCNQCLGQLEESTFIIEQMKQYLEKHNEQI